MRMAHSVIQLLNLVFYTLSPLITNRRRRSITIPIPPRDASYHLSYHYHEQA